MRWRVPSSTVANSQQSPGPTCQLPPARLGGPFPLTLPGVVPPGPPWGRVPAMPYTWGTHLVPMGAQHTGGLPPNSGGGTTTSPAWGSGRAWGLGPLGMDPLCGWGQRLVHRAGGMPGRARCGPEGATWEHRLQTPQAGLSLQRPRPWRVPCGCPALSAKLRVPVPSASGQWGAGLAILGEAAAPTFVHSGPPSLLCRAALALGCPPCAPSLGHAPRRASTALTLRAPETVTEDADMAARGWLVSSHGDVSPTAAAQGEGCSSVP